MFDLDSRGEILGVMVKRGFGANMLKPQAISTHTCEIQSKCRW